MWGARWGPLLLLIAPICISKCIIKIVYILAPKLMFRQHFGYISWKSTCI